MTSFNCLTSTLQLSSHNRYLHMATTSLFTALQALAPILNYFTTTSNCTGTNVQDVSNQVQQLLPILQRSCIVKNKIHLTSDFLPPQALMSPIRYRVSIKSSSFLNTIYIFIKWQLKTHIIQHSIKNKPSIYCVIN